MSSPTFPTPLPTKGRAGVDKAPAPPPMPPADVPISLAGKLRTDSERGIAGELKIDYEVALGGGSEVPSLIEEFVGAGPWGRDGWQPCGAAAVVAKGGPRSLIVESERPGRSGRYNTRELFEPAVGADGSLHSPQAWTWFETVLRDLRESPDVSSIPLLVLVESDAIGQLTPELTAALEQLAKDQRACVAIIRRVVGLRGTGSGAVRWEPFS